MADDKVVQPEDTSKEGADSTEETQTQPSVEEQIAKAMGEQAENISRKIQSASDKAIARIQREAESTAGIAEDALATMDATFADTDVEAGVKPKPKRQDQYRSQLNVRRQQEEAVRKTIDAFESNIRQHITDLGIDPDDKSIDWGDSNDLSLTERQGKILASISKIQKENAKLVEEKAEDKFKKLESDLRKDLGLDSVDTSTSASVGGDSDSAFIEGIGDGSIGLDTKAKVDRAKKLGLM